MSELKENPKNVDRIDELQGSEQKVFADQILKTIEDENAHDAEDYDNKQRYEIPFLNYESMSLDQLTRELKRLIHTEKVQAIKEHVDAIKSEFERQFADILEEKKEAFIEEGGSEIDFYYVSPVRNEFYKLYNEYKDKRQQYYKELEQKLQLNLARRQDIISEIKNLVSTDANSSDIDINGVFKKFKDLKEQWYLAGPVPREAYSDLWNNYNHHVENFYDYLDLNKDLREMDFRHNLEEKQKLIKKAEELLKESDANKAFRELQFLHKVWKEETGPVSRQYREEIWKKFSELTKIIHDKRQEYLKNIEKSFEENLELRNEIIDKIRQINNKSISSHNGWQKAIKELEALREQFFKIGRVPAHFRDDNWKRFKEVVREFNHTKNGYYKNLKKTQQENLQKKIELIQIAKDNQDSRDWEVTTPLMKKIQDDWKKIGHVPRSHADTIWKEFKDACNYYFNQLNKDKDASKNEENEIFIQKKNFLEELKKYTLSGDKDKDVKQLQDFVDSWNKIGKTSYGNRNVDARFDKVINALYKKLNFDKQKIELIKYNNRLELLVNEQDESLIVREQLFVRRKIEELESEILQLENNLLFFSNVEKDNPLVRDVVKKIENQKSSLEVWKAKLQELKAL